MKSLLVSALTLSTIISLAAQQSPAEVEKKDTIYIGGAESFLMESKDWHNAVGYLIKKEFRPYKYVRKVIYLDEPKLMAIYQCYDQKYITEDSSESYVKTIKDGAFEERYRDGQTKISCKYVNDELDGDFKVFYPSGQLKRHEVWQLGKWIEGKCFDETGAEIPYTDFVTMPTLQGEDGANYVYRNKKSDHPRIGMECTTIMGFIVNTDGTLDDIHIIESSGDCDNEDIMRVMKTMPKWEPAKANNVPIRAEYSIFLKTDVIVEEKEIQIPDNNRLLKYKLNLLRQYNISR